MHGQQTISDMIHVGRCLTFYCPIFNLTYWLTMHALPVILCHTINMVAILKAFVAFDKIVMVIRERMRDAKIFISCTTINSPFYVDVLRSVGEHHCLPTND
uniref:Uncharacterized protein n=1 Tax=Ditylum brightwellii TaxID=49249 RepID=A0A7S2ECR2_9STRA